MSEGFSPAPRYYQQTVKTPNHIRKVSMLPKNPLVTTLLLAAVLGGAPARAAQTAGLTLKYSMQSPPVTVTVSGTVREKRTGNPIPNAQVRAHIVVWGDQGPEMFERCPYQETTADVSGDYRFGFVTALTTSGPMRGKDGLCVSAGAPGYETQPQYARPNVTPQNCAFTNFDFQLSPGKAVRGSVVTAAGQPVSGATVRVQNGLNGDWNFFGSMGRTVTAGDGSFQLWLGVGSDYLGTPWLCILKPGAGSLLVWDLTAKEDLGALTLDPGGNLAGRVVSTNGAPVPDCEVSARGLLFDLIGKTQTGPDGRYLLQGVPGEASLRAFFMRKNGSYDTDLARIEVYARPSPDLSLKDAPHFAVTAQDGKAVTVPHFVVGADTSVAGTLLPSKTALGLGGLMVRLDDKWQNMVQADVNGHFRFPCVPSGKHTLTAYLPHNLRYDRGIGQTRIEVLPGQPLQDAQIQLADLAELRVQYLDAKGNPLPDITAAATWSKSGDGLWTEGTVSDKDGWAVLYLYPDATQYLGGSDSSGTLIPEARKELKPAPGQVMPSLQVVMVPAATLSGRLLDAQSQPLGGKTVLAALNLADGATHDRRFKTAADGRFRLEDITPGILRLNMEVDGILYQDLLGKAVEVPPGAAEDLGDIILGNGLDIAKVASEKQAQAITQPQELTQAAQDFFDKIRTADYDAFLKPDADWQQFPIVGSYQTYKWFDVLVPWICRTFKTNPIVNVELGKVYANPQPVNEQKGLPTVPYKLTLRDGSTLQGNLPFAYEFEAGKGHWFGLQGIDWHLMNEAKQ